VNVIQVTSNIRVVQLLDI